MKILMVNKFLYPRGGSESYMLKLGKFYAENGHEVQYFGMYDEQNTVSNNVGIYTGNMDFHSSSLSRFLYPFKIIFSFEAAKKIGKVLDDFKPDVVHMNNINFQLTPSIIYAVKKRRIPLIQTVHDYQMICPNHLFYSFKEEKPCTRCLGGSKLSCVKYSCIHDSKVKSIIGVFEAWLYSFLRTYKKVDLFICPSKFLEEKLHKSASFYKEKTFTIHNFIEKKNFEKNDKCEPYVFFAGRLSKEKGVKLLAETALLLPDIKFVVAGSGPDGEVLENIPNIHLVGFLTGDELCAAMGNAKALLLSSVCFENCPLSILEAHSFGVPSITMNYGGMAELVDDGVNGSLCSDATAEELAETIRKTVSDEEYLSQISENCIKTADDILTVEEYGNILLEKYKNLISE